MPNIKIFFTSYPATTYNSQLNKKSPDFRPNAQVRPIYREVLLQLNTVYLLSSSSAINHQPLTINYQQNKPNLQKGKTSITYDLTRD
ncbi:MAG: hypothetical protein ACYTE8_06265 [Planctomycetota bacterium]|jgi:hypothetical protein